MSAVTVNKVTLRFGGVTALDNVSIEIPAGRIFALIGPNGAGKTTLFNVMTGVYDCPEGKVYLNKEDVTGLQPFRLARKGLTRTFQNLQIFGRMTAAENVMVGCHMHERLSPLVDMFGLPSVRRQNAASRSRALELLGLVGLGEVGDRLAAELPYGALKRLEIARALAAEPKVIMLDEPVAGCNAVETAEVSRVIRTVADANVTVVLVEHDMGLVMKLADRVHVLNRGATLAEGTPAEILSNPAVVEAYLGTTSILEDKQRAHS